MKSLELNSLCEISLDGLATDEHGGPMTLTMSRTHAPVLPVTWNEYDPVHIPVAPRLPSALPAPGAFTLNITLEEKIGDGRSGVVYGVQIKSPASQSSANHSFDIPALVAKVCIPNRTDDMVNEASCYDEMECLQGVGIPRCYGLFQCRAVVPALHKYRISQHEKQLAKENQVLEDRQYYEYRRSLVPKDGQKFDPSLPIPKEPEYIPFTRPPPPLCEDTISVLLLERVGGHIPLGRALPDHLEEDLTGIYADMARLSVAHHDIRWANVLTTLPVDEGGLPGLPSPFTHRTYNFRVVDFDQAQKWSIDYWEIYHTQYIGRITDNIPYNCVVEYWE